MPKKKPEVILIDGRNYAYRNGYTRIGLSSKGRPSGAIFGSLHGLIRLNRFFPDAAIVFCWDGNKSSKSWRHKLCPDYKSNRVTDKTKESKIPQAVHDIRAQIPVLESVLETLSFAQFSVPKFEADDLIGVLAEHLSTQCHKVMIYSTDRDFYQLIRDNIVVVRDIDKAKKCQEITAREIKKEYGVAPKDWLKFRAFVGDPGDRIAKPIKGIGGVKALKILASGVNPAKKHPHKDYVEHWDAIRMAYQLSKIVRSPEDKRITPFVKKRLSRIIEKNIDDMFRDAPTKKAYRQFTAFLADYDMEQLMEVRHVIWNIR